MVGASEGKLNSVLVGVPSGEGINFSVHTAGGCTLLTVTAGTSVTTVAIGILVDPAVSVSSLSAFLQNKHNQ